ncbi:TetR/AcrR family transcriptional regulator [Bradyrhizobium sp. HKCCYLS2038]|uniref:TetR/AcrR family transcriptional regulator n=1 Tax=unclassified Bradyrhizobium TaxID=2631580 RepID=UPI003EBAC2D6
MRRKDVITQEASVRTPRAPRQARGRERREQLLDAAAALIAESGLAAVSMHATAARAGASIGSVYHFFRDKDQMLDALAERHDVELQPAFHRMRERSDAEWAALSASEVLEQLIGWALRYFVRHPDALATLDLHDKTTHAEFRAVIDRVMRARLGAELGAQAATTFEAVVLGTLLFTREQDPRSRDVVVAALPEMMAAYLTALEAKRKRAKG